MKKNNIENRIREGFEQKESQIDKFELWQEIEKELPEEKKDRRFFFWYFFVGLMVSASILWYYLPNRVNAENVTTTLTAESTIEQQDIAITNTVPMIAQVGKVEGEISQKKDHENRPDIPAMELEHIQKKNPRQSFENNILPSPNNTYHSSRAETKVTAAPTTKSALQSKATLEGLDQKEQESRKVNFSFTQVPPLPKKNFPIEYLAGDTIDFAIANRSNIISSEKIISPVSLKPKWSISTIGNYLALDRKITGADQELIDEKSKVETLLYGASADLMIQYGILPCLSIGLGLDYTRMEEKIEWSGQGATIRDVQSDSASFFEYFEQAIYIPGTTKQTTTVTRSLRNYNEIEQWFIPLELVFIPVQRKRFSLQFIGGFKYNVSSRLNGKYLGKTNTILEGEDIYSTYKKKNIHAWYSGVGLSFKPTRRWSMVTELKYQSSQNFLQASTDAQLKYEGYVIGLGLQRSF